MPPPNELTQRWQSIEDALHAAALRAHNAAGCGVGQSKTFAFARIVRGWAWGDKDGKRIEPTAEAVADYIESTFIGHWKPLRERYGPVGSFWDGQYIDGEDPRGEFLAAWDAVRIAEGETLFHKIEQNMAALPLKPCRPRSDKFCEFISFAGHLQRLRAPGQTIQLPVVFLGKRFGVSSHMISRYRRWAREDGILQEVHVADSLRKLATEFVFELNKFDWKSGRQIPIEPTVKPAIEPIIAPKSGSTGGSTIGLSSIRGFPETPQRTNTEPSGASLTNETQEPSTLSQRLQVDTKKLSKTKAMLPMTDEQYGERHALLKAQAEQLRKRGIQ